MASRLKDEEKKKILADYIETSNYRETARINNVSDDTVRRLVAENEDDVKQKLAQKKQENTISTLEYMQEQHEAKKRILDKLLRSIELKAEDIENIDKMNIKDLATAYGIILDKELKLKEIDQKLNDNTNFDGINSMITNIANLINNPIENRTEESMDGVQDK